MKKTGWILSLMALVLLSTSISALADDGAPPVKLKLRDAAAPPTGVSANRNADPVTGMQFVFVKGGCYQMGSAEGGSDEKPVHQVCLSDFYMGKYLVTQSQWERVMGNNPSHFTQCGPDCPVESISWNDAQDFIRKLDSQSGKQYRLPTEAEWEYAARSGGKDEKWAGTSDESSLGRYAWYDKNSGQTTHKVGLKKPNGLGLYDMSGNVWEWCQDWFNEAYYEDSPKDNPTGADAGESRVLRGGSWSYRDYSARAADRLWLVPASSCGGAYGLRLVLPAN